MSFLENVDLGNNVTDSDSDVISGGRSQVVESGVYPLRVSMAYLDESQGGAKCLKVHFDAVDNSFKFRQSFWLTTSKAKGCRTWYEQAGKQVQLPGYSAANHLAIAITGKELKSQTTAKKVIKLWNYDAKAELPVEVEAVVDMIGKLFQGGVMKIVENKKVLNDGKWVPVPEKKIFNEVSKIFNEDGLTISELKSGVKVPEFLNKWKAKFAGVEGGKFDSTVPPLKEDTLEEYGTVVTEESGSIFAD